MPQHHAARDRHVDRVLDPRLGNLDGAVAAVHDLLLHAGHLVAEDQRIAFARLRPERSEHRRALDLLHRKDFISRSPQLLHTLRRSGMIAPRHGQLRSQRRFVNLARRGRRRDAAQGDAFHRKGIARAEKGADVLRRAHVVEHHRDGHFGPGGIFLGRRTAQFFVRDFAHDGFRESVFGAKCNK